MTTLRIFGDKLGESDCFVDAVVDNVDIDGNATLVEDVDTDPRSWIVSIDDVDEWRTNDYAADHSALSDPNHAAWTKAAEIWNGASDDAIASSEYEVREAIEKLFRHVLDAQRR